MIYKAPYPLDTEEGEDKWRGEALMRLERRSNNQSRDATRKQAASTKWRGSAVCGFCPVFGLWRHIVIKILHWLSMNSFLVGWYGNISEQIIKKLCLIMD